MMIVGTGWTSEQLRTLYANVFARNDRCPTCDSSLRLALSKEADILGVAQCDACEVRHLVALHNDPERHAFRPYTDDERRALISADRLRKPIVCPVDGTELDMHLQRSLARTSNVILRCRRCRRTVEYVRHCG